MEKAEVGEILLQRGIKKGNERHNPVMSIKKYFIFRSVLDSECFHITYSSQLKLYLA
jgi:hypothetical protein